MCVYKKEEDLTCTMICILSLDDGNNCSDNGNNFPRSWIIYLQILKIDEDK